jgi:catechol 2,3-dioxygenase-like lactoylglutathione lyase family enzyme
MTSRLVAVTFAAHDPARLAGFWSGLLRRELGDDGLTVLPGDDRGFRLRFRPSDEEKVGQNQMHFDLTSTSLDDQAETVARALALGGRHLDIGQGPAVDHVVLADPEGNELCVIEPGNSFLAGCGFLGCVSSDGTREVGCFWSEAFGWPLVWDQDEETAIQSPAGGSKISWGGPPVAPKRGTNRLHLDLAPPPGADQQQAEVERLVSLGATRLHVGRGGAGEVAMADPDGNEFWVLAGAAPVRASPCA